MTLLFPDADDIADRADQARQADMDARCRVCGEPIRLGFSECTRCWLDADRAFERGQDQ